MENWLTQIVDLKEGERARKVLLSNELLGKLRAVSEHSWKILSRLAWDSIDQWLEYRVAVGCGFSRIHKEITIVDLYGSIWIYNAEMNQFERRLANGEQREVDPLLFSPTASE